MLRRRAKQLICAVLDDVTTTATQRYQVPTGTRTTITAATVTNPSGAEQTVDISVDLTDSRIVRLIWARAVPVNASFVLPSLIGQTLETGTTLYADASVSGALHLTISGYEESEA